MIIVKVVRKILIIVMRKGNLFCLLHLLYSEFGGIWCSTQYLNQAVLYYDNIDNYQCFFVNTLNSDKTKVSIDNDTYNKILFVIENYYNENKENIKSSENDRFVNIYAQSKNDLLQFELVNDALVKNGNVFYVTDRTVYDNDKIYYTGKKIPVTYE